jgi:transcriptional regulator with XRE-family HTH domain
MVNFGSNRAGHELALKAHAVLPQAPELSAQGGTTMTRGRKADLKPSQSPLHFFGSEVRRTREAAGMSLGDLAARVPCDPSTVSRIEAGILAPDRHFAVVCDEAFPDLGGWFTRFYDKSRDWNQPFAPSFGSFTPHEATATSIYTCNHSLIPGLLQTEDYAREVLSRSPTATDGELAERLTGRLARQAILRRDDPPWYWVVIDEAVLHRRVSNEKIMYAALRRLVDASLRPKIILQVLAGGAPHPGLMGSCQIAETIGARTIASLEDFSDSMLVEDSATIAKIMTRFRWLQSEALSADASRERIEQLAEELWRQNP